jgi:hypothetical protein
VAFIVADRREHAASARLVFDTPVIHEFYFPTVTRTVTGAVLSVAPHTPRPGGAVQQRRYGRPVSIGQVKVFDPLCSVKADLIVTRLELVGKLRDLALTLEAVDHHTDDVENSEPACLLSLSRKQSPNHPKMQGD